MITVSDDDGQVMYSVRTAYSPPIRHQKSFKKKSLTKASMQAECDINQIMAKYQKSGLIEAPQKANGQYGDFTGIGSYQDALNQVIAAQDAFDALPSSLRKRFQNDPAELLAFLDDEGNLGEARELGLIPPEPVEDPAPEASPEPTKKPPAEPEGE